MWSEHKRHISTLTIAHARGITPAACRRCKGRTAVEFIVYQHASIGPKRTRPSPCPTQTATASAWRRWRRQAPRIKSLQHPPYHHRFIARRSHGVLTSAWTSLLICRSCTTAPLAELLDRNSWFFVLTPGDCCNPARGLQKKAWKNRNLL